MRSFIFFLIILFIALSQKSQTNYYFGNLHSHTGFSDGNQDSVISGVKNPSGAYTYADLSQNFDFLGISEHNHYSSAKNPGFKKQNYQVGLNMANSANQDGSFLALFGVEWGVASTYSGHLLIYGFNQLIGWETSVPGVSGNNYDIFNAKTDYDGIFKKVKNNSGAFCFLAHPSLTDFTTNGLSSTALANAPYNSAYDSAIVGIPLRSGLAYSTFTNYTDYSNFDYFDYYKKLLSKGYHIGIGYDHDNHNTTFGRSNGGRLVAIMPSLTRANLITAMQKMNFYASDDWNAKINFNIGGNIMGSILTGSTNPVINVIHDDADGESAKTIKIWKGINNNSNTLPQLVYTISNNNTATYSDASGMYQGVEYYYFAEIKQNDNQWIVTSPIWFTNTSPTPIDIGVEEYSNDFEYNFFPNPVSETLTISMSKCDDYKLSLIDFAGRVVFEKYFFDQHATLNLSSFSKGIYNLQIEGKNATKHQKLVVE